MKSFAHKLTSNITILFLILIVSITTASAKIKVIATFSILGDMVQNIGGDNIELTTLVGPNGDGHVYEPTPADAKSIATGDIVFVNGLGFEGWIDRLVKASGYKGKVIIATEGIKNLEFEGALDPHAWQDLSNGRIYIKNIKNSLIDVDPKNSALYKKNFIAYDKILESMDKSTKDNFKDIAKKNRKVITSHDAFLYFGRAYDIDFRSPVGVTTENEPSAGELAALITEMREDDIKALFAENITDPRLIKQLAREVNAEIGGILYSDALSDNSEPANTYINMFKYNVNELLSVLSK
ncbi:zinc ABC transporter substrate-binding protein [Alphaproteobacteria bacterium]|nr:zinc ABC transporter substrate-binding protein [Alphaproteobacteria bacterium]